MISEGLGTLDNRDVDTNPPRVVIHLPVSLLVFVCFTSTLPNYPSTTVFLQKYEHL